MNGDKLIRASTAAVVVGVAGVAAFVSYRHAFEVATAHGETGVTATLIPLTVDGLVFTASMVLLDAARRGDRAPKLARLALALGIGATVAANVLHGISAGPVGAVISAWPAVCLVLVAELLMGMIRRGRATGTHVPVREAVPAEVATGSAKLAEPSEAEAPTVGVMPDVPVFDPVVVTARERFAEVLAAGDLPSVRALRRELRIGHPRASAIRTALAEN